MIFFLERELGIGRGEGGGYYLVHFGSGHTLQDLGTGSDDMT